MKIRVYYEDTDIGGIVYHANYLKYCERARSEIFFNNGLTPIINDAHFVVRKMECDFIKSAKFGDILTVKTKVIEFKNASFLLEQSILNNSITIFNAKVLLVFVKNNRPQKMDQNLKELLQSLFIYSK